MTVPEVPVAPWWESGPVQVWHGDCVDVMRTFPDASFDAVCTDPPYALDFMGHAWDRFTPGGFQHWCEVWAAECLRLLKPGGHLLAFGGTRTWHRLAAGVEDAGFEVRDSIAWLYGSGFPKSLDVSKAIDKIDAVEERRARALRFTAWVRSTGITPARIDELTGTNMGGHYTTAAAQPAVATAELFDLLRPHVPEVPSWVDDLVAERTVESKNYAARVVTGRHETPAQAAAWRARYQGGEVAEATDRRDEAHSDDAKRWQGWGTALKPAFEPVVVARKPLAGAVAANVLAHGTGALNIDACRVAPTDPDAYAAKGASVVGLASNRNGDAYGQWAGTRTDSTSQLGRWPANVVLDEGQAAALDAQSGHQVDGVAVNRNRDDVRPQTVAGVPRTVGSRDDQGYGGSGGASRFFYTAKASTAERPTYWTKSCNCETVKPWLSPRTGTTGSGSDDGTSWSTSTSGNSTTGDQSLPATTSTTSTETSLTTGSRTSSSSPEPSTSASTEGASSETASGGNPAGTAGSSSPSMPLTGTSAARVGRSMDAADPATSDGWSETSVCANCGAPSKREAHSTVKPVDLMRWLVRLVTPPGGVVLEPFAGSGSTVEAAVLEGFRCVAVERDAAYLPLIRRRLGKPHEVGLFEDEPGGVEL